MKVVVDVSGGLDACFEAQKEFKLEVPEGSKMHNLINQLKSICNPKRLDFLVSDDQSLRPGILVLINDVDWELEDKEEYALQNNDRISLISTLHGG